MFKIEGQIKVIGETIQVTEKFSKRDLVISENSSMYPQEISLQMSQDKCSILDGYKVGEQVEVSFNLRGREWTSPQGEVKYFNTLDAWRIEKVGQVPKQEPQNNINPAPIQTEEEDDLPF